MSEERADDAAALGSDPSGWSDELCAQWAACELPGLHDFLLAQERLAMEVRRQNRELQRLAAVAERQVDPADAPAAGASAGSQRALLALADAVERLAGGLARASDAVALALPPRRRWFASRTPWRERVGEIMRAQEEGGRLVVERMRDALDAAHLTAIEPRAGDVFDPACHRAVKLEPGEEGRIVGLLRRGYRSGETVVRAAEVAVARAQSQSGVDG
ncbi:MAG: nucleotide exchange factor GrpE [Planctomycetota bacterium]